MDLEIRAIGLVCRGLRTVILAMKLHMAVKKIRCETRHTYEAGNASASNTWHPKIRRTGIKDHFKGLGGRAKFNLGEILGIHVVYKGGYL